MHLGYGHSTSGTIQKVSLPNNTALPYRSIQLGLNVVACVSYGDFKDTQEIQDTAVDILDEWFYNNAALH